MADYNLQCINCLHPPHANGACNSAKCECKVFVRADIHAARALTNINNALVSELPLIGASLVNLLDILCEAFPEARDRVNQKRQEMIKENTSAGNTDSTAAAGQPEAGAGPGSNETGFTGDGTVVAGAFGPPQEHGSDWVNR